ncbi:MAG: trypsin-like peptidase domain-containing protein [Gemmatimonadota bacterium]|jgi:serine protease Do
MKTLQRSLAATLLLAGCSAPADRQPTEVTIPMPRAGPVPPIDTITATGLSAAFRAAAEHALPSVVRFHVIARASQSLPLNHPETPDTLRLLQGTGSGFIMDSAGHIITNNHVVAGAERVIVTLADGRDWEAEVVGADANTDVAVVRVDTEYTGPLQPARFGDSQTLEVGDWVLALGNPLDLAFTVTAGIVSAKGRNTGILRNDMNTQLEAFIQTDAAVNRGNSGGPLVDLFGRVVGVNTAIQSRTGSYSGASFAIPINLVRKVAADLIQSGTVHRPRLGVSIQDVNSADAELYRLPALAGVEISAVTPGLPAAKAGVRMGDVVMAVDDVPVESVTDLQVRIAGLQPGQRVKLGLIRYGTPMEITVPLAEFAPAERQTWPTRAADRPKLGFSARVITAEEARRRRLQSREMVVLDRLDPYGPALEAHLPEASGRYQILEINGQTIESLDDIERVAKDLEPGDVVSVVILGPDTPDTPASPTVYNYRVW